MSTRCLMLSDRTRLGFLSFSPFYSGIGPFLSLSGFFFLHSVGETRDLDSTTVTLITGPSSTTFMKKKRRIFIRQLVQGIVGHKPLSYVYRAYTISYDVMFSRYKVALINYCFLFSIAKRYWITTSHLDRISCT